MPYSTDIDLTPRDISNLVSVDALAAWFARLNYNTSARRTLTPESFGLSGDSAKTIKRIDLLSEDADGFLRVLFVQPKSLTARIRTELVRALKKQTIDYLLVLSADFETLEFVLLDRQRRERKGNAKGDSVEAVPRVFSVDRRKPSRLSLRHLRRFTWAHGNDPLAQFDKLRQAFEAAKHSEEFFDNRGLFSDHFLLERVRLESVWRENPAVAFAKVRDLLATFGEKHGTGTELPSEETTRLELIEPLFKVLGFTPKANRKADSDEPIPDYNLINASGDTPTKAFAYRWERWLDGPDQSDADTPQENPGACVVSALEGDCDWLIVTNGRQWRLYGKHAHARSTNFYEVDLVEALAVSDETDPNEAFRYWWLFFRPAAFAARSTPDSDRKTAWLDDVLQGSRDHAKRLGDRLKERIFLQIFPSLAQGFLEDRQRRLKIKRAPSEAELGELFEATLTLLYRLLFLLYAESRQLLPVGEAAYGAASLKRLKEEIAEKAGVAQDEVAERLQSALSDTSTAFYDRLSLLFAAMDQGDAGLNVPKYNGGLFNTEPDETDRRSQTISRYLMEHKVPDRALAVAIDRLSRDQDEKTLALVFIDYKSLEVRHLGSIYEGLLEFRLKIAEQDLTTQVEKKSEKYIPLSAARARRGRGPDIVVAAGKVYLSNDKSERKATGSYYTPDPIVEYIVEQTVGPVLAERLEALRPEFRKVRKTYENEVKKATAYPVKHGAGGTWDPVEWGVHQAWIAHKDLVERLFEFRVLDPAMGSGHFLVEAVDFLTDRLLTFLNQFPINPVRAMLAETRRNIVAALTEQGLIVDEKLLTDVNLLKRHVLKRCIYGVDLNPMAVELAKVSLWLDAFTLGAPLSFLDHHLRCGNSLVGATFADLDQVRKGRLFGIDYAPLLEAVRQVLFINTLSDTTAAEVKQSSVQYDHARRNLSGYQIVLDLIVAGRFGQPDGPRILSHAARELDLRNRDAFLAGLTPVESKVVHEVATLAARKDLRFFHWEIEFPEAFFGFEDADQRRLKHKNEMAKGSAGFDAVVGNPPYVRQEAIKPLKEYLKTSFETYDAANDLYVYFQERAVDLLQVERRMGMIVSNKWMRAGYGEGIRQYLKHEAQPIDLIDFGHTPIFPDADTFPCVLVAARRTARVSDVGGEEVFTACPIPRADWSPQLDISAYCRQKRYSLPTQLMRHEVWSLEDPRIHALLDKIRRSGVSLKEFVGSSPIYGIKTGFNEAFCIDVATRDRLIREDKHSREIIRPILRGRDIDRWRTREPNTFLILARRGIEIDRYPAIKRHLSHFRERLEPKPTGWIPLLPSDRWPGRASGNYAWCELQASPGDDAMAALEGPKIVYQDLAWFSGFAVEDGVAVLNNTAYLIPGRDLWLAATLNSTVLWWFMWRTAQHGKDEVLRMFNEYVETLPIARCKQSDQMTEAVSLLLENVNKSQSVESMCVAELVETFSVEADPRIMSWIYLTEDAFLSRTSAIVESSPSVSDKLRRFHRKYRGLQASVLEARLRLEQQVASLVEDAYGLTPDERQLLRDTRPIRDPLDVLRAKIAGTLEQCEPQVAGED